MSEFTKFSKIIKENHQKTEIIDMIKQGMSITEIAKVLSVSRNTIYRRLKRHMGNDKEYNASKGHVEFKSLNDKINKCSVDKKFLFELK